MKLFSKKLLAAVFATTLLLVSCKQQLLPDVNEVTTTESTKHENDNKSEETIKDKTQTGSYIIQSTVKEDEDLYSITPVVQNLARTILPDMSDLLLDNASFIGLMYGDDLNNPTVYGVYTWQPEYYENGYETAFSKFNNDCENGNIKIPAGHFWFSLELSIDDVGLAGLTEATVSKTESNVINFEVSCTGIIYGPGETGGFELKFQLPEGETVTKSELTLYELQHGEKFVQTTSIGTLEEADGKKYVTFVYDEISDRILEHGCYFVEAQFINESDSENPLASVKMYNYFDTIILRKNKITSTMANPYEIPFFSDYYKVTYHWTYDDKNPDVVEYYNPDYGYNIRTDGGSRFSTLKWYKDAELSVQAENIPAGTNEGNLYLYSKLEDLPSYYVCFLDKDDFTLQSIQFLEGDRLEIGQSNNEVKLIYDYNNTNHSNGYYINPHAVKLTGFYLDKNMSERMRGTYTLPGENYFIYVDTVPFNRISVYLEDGILFEETYYDKYYNITPNGNVFGDIGGSWRDVPGFEAMYTTPDFTGEPLSIDTNIYAEGDINLYYKLSDDSYCTLSFVDYETNELISSRKCYRGNFYCFYNDIFYLGNIDITPSKEGYLPNFSYNDMLASSGWLYENLEVKIKWDIPSID